MSGMAAFNAATIVRLGEMAGRRKKPARQGSSVSREAN